ncbi:response regulator [Prosthecochloris sp. GSB1]|uniref:response regulator n=1 Tax=Prosthecochloris sp. GSB1 TaxID=281093 RepID=UPI00142E5BA7|nr:response regulator [Prosthecochloris sp. GSB1]
MNATRQTILVVDDQPGTRRLVAYSLQKAGYRVVTAVNGKDALERCCGFRPDLILCDIMMPEMNGLEFREKLLAHETLRNVPFVFLSARAQTDEVLAARKLDPMGYITKPVEPAKIVETVKRCLE